MERNNDKECAPLIHNSFDVTNDQISLFSSSDKKQDETMTDDNHEDEGEDWKLQIQGNNKIPSYTISTKLSKLIVSSSSSSSYNNNNSSSWKFQSSSCGWNISSKSFLTLTYRPSYTALPSYTKTNCCHKVCDYVPKINTNSTSTTQSFGANKKIPYKSYSYNSNDIKQIKINDDRIHINGIGDCYLCRVYFSSNILKYNENNNENENNENESIVSENAEEELDMYYKRSQLNRKSIKELEDAGDLIKSQVDYDDNNENSDLICVTFAIPKNSNSLKSDKVPLLWRVFIPPIPKIAIETITVLNGTLLAEQKQKQPSHIFINGYQSWSYCSSVLIGQKQPQSAMPNLFSQAFNLGAEYPPINCASKDNIYYHSEFFTSITSHSNSTIDNNNDVDDNGPALVLGWLSQRQQFGLIHYAPDDHILQMHCSCDGLLSFYNIHTDWSYCQILNEEHEQQPLSQYVDTVATYNNAQPSEKTKVGWCSWYHYYENINSKTLIQNCTKLSTYINDWKPELIIIDDGYMSSWGDWTTFKPNNFPNVEYSRNGKSTLEPLSREIKRRGMTPGLWLAPFSADKSSELYKLHPEWVIKNHNGQIANSANCGKFFYGLDASNIHVRKYVYNIIKLVISQNNDDGWGFQALKLDFLYSCCLKGNGKFDLTLSRAQVMDLAIRTLRSAAGPSTYIIGCGCPLGSAVGYIDSMRISADTGPTWRPSFPLPSWDNSTLPALKAMIRNTITRSILGYRWWHNDPDCLLLGTTTSLTLHEVISAASIIAMTGGMILVSDDLGLLPTERLVILHKIVPPTNVTAIALDLHCTTQLIPTMLRLCCSDNLLGKHCISVVKGLGTWTTYSCSNWQTQDTIIYLPLSAVLPSPRQPLSSLSSTNPNNVNKYGYHVYEFWSSKYTWLSPTTKSYKKNLQPHQTEIFHIKTVCPSQPQYIGSSFHFSCGYEVESICYEDDDTSNSSKVQFIDLKLKNDYKRMKGYVFLYLPFSSSSMSEDEEMVCCVNSSPIDKVEEVARIPMVDDTGNNKGKFLGRIIKFSLELSGTTSNDDINLLHKKDNSKHNNGKIRIKF